MITRAQAEALLTLAESLEACGRVNVKLYSFLGGTFISTGAGPKVIDLPSLAPADIRTAVADLMPKHTGS